MVAHVECMPELLSIEPFPLSCRVKGCRQTVSTEVVADFLGGKGPRLDKYAKAVADEAAQQVGPGTD